jgi:hypothetical protein
MGFFPANTCVPHDRYCLAYFFYPAGKLYPLGKLTEFFAENHLWYWNVGTGEDEKRGLEWRYGFMKFVGGLECLTPARLAWASRATAVVVSDEDVGSVMEAILLAGEAVIGITPGVQSPGEGASMPPDGTPLPGAVYAVSADWGEAKAPDEEWIRGRLGELGMEILSVDCGSFNPLEASGNPFGKSVSYFSDYPSIASFAVRHVGGPSHTVGDIRKALSARSIYFPRDYHLGSLDAAAIAKLCAVLRIETKLAFIGSRTAYAAAKVADEILPDDPSAFVRNVIGMAVGGGIAYLGTRLLLLAGRKKG